MEAVPISKNVAMPDESQQANIRICIVLKKNTAGELTTFINEFDVSNYDGLIANVPDFLQEFDVKYGINQIIEASKKHTTKLAH